MGIMRKPGEVRFIPTRRQPISAGDAHRFWIGAVRISENAVKAKFAELTFYEVG
jgi:hypothetical protein